MTGRLVLICKSGLLAGALAVTTSICCPVRGQSAQTKPPSVETKPPSTEEIAADTEQSAVLITGTDPTGKPIPQASGFPIGWHLVATTYSAIKNAAQITVRVGSLDPEPATVVAVNKLRTIALLRLGDDRAPAPGKRFSHPLQTGDTFYSIANKLADHGGLAAGKLSTVRSATPPKYLTVSPPFPQSHNGSAVVSSWGELIGMAVPGDDGSISRVISYTKLAPVLAEMGLVPLSAVHKEDEETEPPVTGPVGGVPGDVPGSVPAGVPKGTSDLVVGGIPSTPEGQRAPLDKSNVRVVKGPVLQGSALRRAVPVYPPLAKAASLTGTVVVEITIDEDGCVISSHALSGHPLLKGAAMAAARGWLFAPTKLSGTPVKVIGTITFNFEK